MVCPIARFCPALAAAVAILAASPAPLRGQPAVTHTLPGAVAPGKTIELTLLGTKLSSPAHVWTSFPVAVSLLPQEGKAADKQLRCKLSMPAQLQPGIAGIAVATSSGISDVTYLMVDDLPSVEDAAGNDKFATAQEISLPVAIDGASGGTVADYFRFTAKAGQPISCEIVANRLGWDFDPVVRLLDASANELAFEDDQTASGLDPRFVFVAPQDGQYVVEVRDNRYKSGGRYRLRIGDFPLVSAGQPLVAQRGTPTEISLLGPYADHFLLPALLTVYGGADQAVTLSCKKENGKASGWFTLGLSDLPVYREKLDDSGGPCEMPCVVSGLIRNPEEVDRWSFKATKGTPLQLKAVTRSLGSAAVLSLKILDHQGKQLAATSVTESDEPVLTYTPATDGQFVLAVEELASRGGVDFGYAVECRSGPQFSLALKNDKSNLQRHAVPKGGAFFLDVQARRAGYAGPIILTIDSPRSGWQVFGNVIAEKANETRLYIVPPADLDVAEIADLRVIGRAQSGEHALTATMTTTTQLRAARPYFPYPPAWHDGTIFVSALAARPAFYTVSSPSVVEFDTKAGQAALAIQMERLDEKFKDAPLTLIPLGLPPGVSAEIKRSAAGPKETYNLLLKGLKGLPAGQHTFRYFTYAELSGQGQAFYSGDIRLITSDAAPKPAEETKAP